LGLARCCLSGRKGQPGAAQQSQRSGYAYEIAPHKTPLSAAGKSRNLVTDVNIG
jgi:hypothetical protein